MDLKARVGQRLREFRRTNGLTQEALAASVERSVDAISALERGVALPSFEMLARLGEVLKVPLSSFFDQEGEDDPERTAQLARLTAEATRLTNDELAIAIEQVAAFNRRKRA